MRTAPLMVLLLLSTVFVRQGLAPLSGPEMARGNVAPLVNGTTQPVANDPFNAADLLLIERKALGAVSN